MSFNSSIAPSANYLRVTTLPEASDDLRSMFIHWTDDVNHSQEVTVWADYKPTFGGCIVYLFIVPTFCMIGIFSNSLNIWMFSRPRIRAMACSAYFYFKGNQQFTRITNKNMFRYYSYLNSGPFFVLSATWVMLGPDHVSKQNFMDVLRHLCVYSSGRYA